MLCRFNYLRALVYLDGQYTSLQEGLQRASHGLVVPLAMPLAMPPLGLAMGRARVPSGPPKAALGMSPIA